MAVLPARASCAFPEDLTWALRVGAVTAASVWSALPPALWSSWLVAHRPLPFRHTWCGVHNPSSGT